MRVYDGNDCTLAGDLSNSMEKIFNINHRFFLQVLQEISIIPTHKSRLLFFYISAITFFDRLIQTMIWLVMNVMTTVILMGMVSKTV